MVTLEQIKERFKKAKIVMCLSSYREIDLVNSEIKRDIHLFGNSYWIDYSNEERTDSVLIWDKQKGYSEIIEFKDSEITIENQLSKYHVPCKGVKIDVYDVLKAFNVVNPATQHAIKKLLKGGQRGFKDVNKDYQEAIESIERAIELNK
jgi:hypothetical protein